VREVRGVLGAQFVGMYLYGSLSNGDFDPVSSDIDFLVVTDATLPGAMVAMLGELHARIAASGTPWADRLEGSYIPRAAIRRYDPANNCHPTIGADWEFGIGAHNENWVIERAIVRERGVVIAGPPAPTLIDPITPDELRAAVRACLDPFWERQTEGQEPEWLRRRHYQAFAILTMCRACYTLEHGTVPSKFAAAQWAQETLPPPWPALIARALSWRSDHAPDDMTEMRSFIRYTVRRAAGDGVRCTHGL
jgi:Domain of unknown function (DUF4111)/Nucleotidyltransferase domain